MTVEPKPGQTWNILDFASMGIEFTTMIGTFVWPGKGQQTPDPPPANSNLSLHFWSLKEEDAQTPHKQDEAYYVVKGRGKLTIDGREHALKSGDLIFVPRGADHRFSEFKKEGLVLLVIFGPNFTG